MESNPTVDVRNGVHITSAFKRFKLKKLRGQKQKQNPRQVGDNCPFIYALKKKDGLTTSRKDVLSLYNSLAVIIPQFIEKKGHWDMVIPLPSSHNIGLILATRVQRNSPGSVLITDALAKKNIFEVRAEVNALNMDVEDERYFNRQLQQQRKEAGGSWQAPYSLKTVATNKRHLLNPLKMGQRPSFRDPNKILLVDDVVSSGTTLAAGLQLLQSIYPRAQIEAFSLFGAAGAGQTL